MTQRLQNPPLALYVHLPWCVRKCPYCDFNSHAIDAAVPEERYVSALLRDLDRQLAGMASRPVVSVFLGGGTPSLFSPAAIARLIDGIGARLALARHAEISMEANPGTIERGRFAEYRSGGINRVSLGGQSFDARHLAALGRIHSPAETIRAAEELHAAGIENFNIDLMYGLPQQTVAEAQADVAQAIALRPAHLSHYQLTLEPGTVFHHRPPPLPDEDASWEMQMRCQALLAASGWRQYEISAYATRDRQCVHNLNYWRFGDYIGIGAGAHGKLTSAESGTIQRTTHVRQPRQYLAGIESSGGPERRAVGARELPFEYMLNALRLIDGFTLREFESTTGLAYDVIAARLEAARVRGLLAEPLGERWRATALGLRFLNDLQLLFLDEEPCVAAPVPPKQAANSL